MFGINPNQLIEVPETLKNSAVNKFIKELFKLYPNLITDFIKKFYVKGNINKAIESKNEIMLVSKKIYAIKATEFWRVENLLEK